jgi:hypothetical protein
VTQLRSRRSRNQNYAAEIHTLNTEPEAIATGSRFGSAILGSQNDPVATASGSVFLDPLWRSTLVSLARLRQADKRNETFACNRKRLTGSLYETWWRLRLYSSTAMPLFCFARLSYSAPARQMNTEPEAVATGLVSAPRSWGRRMTRSLPLSGSVFLDPLLAHTNTKAAFFFHPLILQSHLPS